MSTSAAALLQDAIDDVDTARWAHVYHQDQAEVLRKITEAEDHLAAARRQIQETRS